MPRTRSRNRPRENSVPRFVSEPVNRLLQAKIRNTQYKLQMNRKKEEGKQNTNAAMHLATLKVNLNRFHMNNPPDPAYPLILQPPRSRTRNRTITKTRDVSHTLKRQLPSRSISFIMRMSKNKNKNKNKHVRIIENV